MAACKVRTGDGRSPRLSANSVFHVALKPERKVIPKGLLIDLVSGGPAAKRTALRPQGGRKLTS